jgi:hypothetical protein
VWFRIIASGLGENLRSILGYEALRGQRWRHCEAK